MTRPACRWLRAGQCALGRYGQRPSPGVCRLCKLERTDRILGLGDVVRLLTWPLHRLPATRRVAGCGGCARRQAQLNRVVPIRWEHDRAGT